MSLDLLAVTDFHGHIERTTDSRTGALIDPGAVTLACEVAAARAENANTLFASAGDNVGATSYTSSILKDVPTMEVLDAMRLDVSAVGNHELDGGVSDLTDRIIPAVSFPYLAANVSGSTVLDAEGSGGGTFVKTVDGVRVGFVGVVTDELSTLVSPAGLSGLTISPALATANARPTPSRTVTSPTARRMWSWSSATRTPPSRPARSPRAWTPSLPATHMCPSPRP